MKAPIKAASAIAAAIAVFATLVALTACERGRSGPPSPAPGATVIKFGSTPAPSQENIFYAAGTSGTYTVPTGAFVTMLSAVAQGDAAADASAGYIQITPNGLGYEVVDAGPEILLGASQTFTLGRPTLVGSLYELGPGSVIVFSGTTQYVVTMVQAR